MIYSLTVYLWGRSIFMFTGDFGRDFLVRNILSIKQKKDTRYSDIISWHISNFNLTGMSKLVLKNRAFISDHYYIWRLYFVQLANHCPHDTPFQLLNGMIWNASWFLDSFCMRALNITLLVVKLWTLFAVGLAPMWSSDHCWQYWL